MTLLPHDDSQPQTPEQALLNLRIIWGAMVMAALTLSIVLTVMTFQSPPPNHGMIWLFSGAPAVMLVLAAVIGHLARQQIFKANWQDNAVTPDGYAKATIVYLAMHEFIVTVTAIFMLVGGPIHFNLPIIAAALALMAINFPTGKPTQPASPGDRIGNFNN